MSSPDKVEYQERTINGVVHVLVTVPSEDIGKVIGKNGKLVKALRTLLRLGGKNVNKRYRLEVKECA